MYMKTLIAALAALTLAPAASAGLRVGIVNPTPVPATAARELDSTMQRYDLTWRGETTFTGTLEVAPDTTPVLALYPVEVGYSAAMAPAFCAWVGSVLDRYRVPYVIVGNEPSVQNGVGYANVLAACAPIVRAHGAKVVGPGLPPAGWYWTQQFLNAIAARGRGLLDAFDFHPYWYSGLSFDRDVVQRVHATLGLHVQAWITEDGIPTHAAWWYTTDEAGQAQRVAADVIDARCSGVSVWLNFLFSDEGGGLYWTSGLIRADGSRKPAFTAFAAASRSTWCPSSSPTPPPKPPPPPRPGFRMPEDPNTRGWW